MNRTIDLGEIVLSTDAQEKQMDSPYGIPEECSMYNQ